MIPDVRVKNYLPRIIVDEVVISVEVGNGEAGGSSAGSGTAPAEDKQALIAFLRTL